MKNLIIKINRKSKSYRLKIKTDPDAMRAGYGKETSQEYIFNIASNMLKVFNYSIDLGAEYDDKKTIIELNDTCAETKSLNDLFPVALTLKMALETHGYKVSKIK